jgi:hypothetical protein
MLRMTVSILCGRRDSRGLADGTRLSFTHSKHGIKSIESIELGLFLLIHSFLYVLIQDESYTNAINSLAIHNAITTNNPNCIPNPPSNLSPTLELPAAATFPLEDVVTIALLKGAGLEANVVVPVTVAPPPPPPFLVV